MYTVVGCNQCSSLWVVDGRPETTECPRCRTRHRFENLRALAETDAAEAARDARSRLLQERSDADADLEDFATMGEDAAGAGMSDEAYLSASGIDAEEVAAAGESPADGDRSRQEIVRDAVREQDAPTLDDVVAYAADHGVERGYVERTLGKLREEGELSESRGQYRLL